MTKWYCRKCWRNGTLEFGDMDLAEAIRDHRLQVQAGMEALAKPWGAAVLDVPMVIFPGMYCAGDVLLGETRHKKRFKPGPGVLDFGSDPIDVK